MVSVGINDYMYDKTSDLTHSIADADSMAYLFSRRNSEIVTLHNSEATLEKIKKTVSEVFGKSTKRDIIVFFFSGHGFLADNGSTGGFCPYDWNQTFSSGLSYDDVRSFFKGQKAFAKILIADACHSGDIRTSHKAEINETQQKMLDKTQIITILSSRGNEYSFDYNNLVNGYFTTHLLEGLKGGADVNNDSLVTTGEISKYLQQHVKESFTGSANDAQHPVIWGNYNNNFILMNNKQ